VLLFSGLLLVLAAKGDGHFPLPPDTSEPLFQLFMLALALLFAAGLMLLFRIALGQPAPPAPALRLSAAISALFAAGDLVVIWLEAKRFAGFGYVWHLLPTALATLLPAALLIVIAVRRTPPRPWLLLAINASCYAVLLLDAILYFPLHPARSQSMPLLVAAGHRLLSGHDPYAAYFLVPGAATSLLAMPGALLAYLPAPLLGIDPRFISGACTLVAALLLARRSGGAATAYLGPFLLCPLLIYRHDLTLAPCFLLLAMLWLALGRRHALWLGACCGVLLVTAQLLVIPVAAAAVFVLRREGFAVFARVALIALGVGLAITLPFVLPDPRVFANGALHAWTEARTLQGLNLSYWLVALLPLPAVRALQATAVALLLFARPRRIGSAPRRGRREETAGLEETGLYATLGGAVLTADGRSTLQLWINPAKRRSTFASAALALAAFLMLNTVVWTSFYLLVLFLALLALLPRTEAQREPAAAQT
jgi:hypothetical protein